MTDLYRHGNHRPNHIYQINLNGQSFQDDVEIGMMMTNEAGILVVRALNHYVRCATSPIKSGLGLAEGNPREVERQRRRDLAGQQADKLGRAIACQTDDPISHQRCFGPRAVGLNKFGCLCECHDHQALTDTPAQGATA